MRSFFTFLVAAQLMALISRNSVALSLQPPAGQARFLVRIADQYLAQGRMERAVEVYQLALKAEPGNQAARQALINLGIELSNPATR